MWRYVLRSKLALNARSERREFEGALIRVGDGFGCIHPWPELGDPELEFLLRELGEGFTQEPLVERALFMAESDARARSNGHSFFGKGKNPVPPSHATIPDLGEAAVGEAIDRGYSVVKGKGGQDYAAWANRVNDLSRRWPSLRWRLDFNEVLSRPEVIEFARCLSSHARERIDFLEDPCPYDRNDWAEIRLETGFKLAVDREESILCDEAVVLVVKPAKAELNQYEHSTHWLVVTSYMEHPVGQCFAAVHAARLAARTDRVLRCGLQTHELFEPTEFSERLGPAGPVFHPPGGTGFGFDDLLEKLPWKRLK